MDGREVAGRPSSVPSGLGSQLLLPLLSAAVGLVVVVGAALAGPWQVTPRATPSIVVPTQTATAPPTADPVDVAPPEPSESGVPVTLILVVLGILLLAALVRMFLRRVTLARGTTGAPYDPSPGAVGAAEAIEVEPDLPALRRGVTAARALLASGADPDDAIIAAWLELEAAAGSSGVERAPSDTPTELTTAVLDATSADPEATRRLLSLYHRARFAPHAVMTPADVAEAGRCLERLAESWEGR